MSTPHPSVLPSLGPIVAATVTFLQRCIPGGPQSPLGQPSSGVNRSGFGERRRSVSWPGPSVLGSNLPGGSLSHTSLCHARAALTHSPT